jgi:hypothetical protein
MACRIAAVLRGRATLIEVLGNPGPELTLSMEGVRYDEPKPTVAVVRRRNPG